MEHSSLEIGEPSSKIAPLDVSNLGSLLRVVRFALFFIPVVLLLCIAAIIGLSVVIANHDDDIDRLEGRTSLYLTRTVNKGNRDSEAQSLFAGSGYWIEKSDLPSARSDHAAIAVDDLIYIIGGLNANDSVLDEVLIYDTVLDTYRTGPALQTPLYRFGSAFDKTNRRIYVFGGLTDPDARASDRMYVLDVSTNTGEWTEGPRMSESRSDLCGAFLNGRIYAIGGYSLDYSFTLPTMESYSPNDQSWRTETNMTTPRGDCKAVSISGSVLVIGGYYDEANEWNPDSFRSEVEIYSPSTKVWKSGAKMKYSRGDKAVAALPGDRVLVMGGETHNRGEHTNVATHRVQEYVFSEDVWIEKSSLPEATLRAAAAHVDGMVFVFGGHKQCNVSFDPPQCVESDKLQVYFDYNHPNVFIN
eukprot:g5409.t1